MAVQMKCPHPATQKHTCWWQYLHCLSLDIPTVGKAHCWFFPGVCSSHVWSSTWHLGWCCVTSFPTNAEVQIDCSLWLMNRQVLLPVCQPTFTFLGYSSWKSPFSDLDLHYLCFFLVVIFFSVVSHLSMLNFAALRTFYDKAPLFLERFKSQSLR